MKTCKICQKEIVKTEDMTKIFIPNPPPCENSGILINMHINCFNSIENLENYLEKLDKF